MKVFEYVIFHNPKKEGETPKIIVQVTQVLAKDIQQANVKASRSIPDEYIDLLDEVVIAVRPF